MFRPIISRSGVHLAAHPFHPVNLTRMVDRMLKESGCTVVYHTKRIGRAGDAFGVHGVDA